VIFLAKMKMKFAKLDLNVCVCEREIEREKYAMYYIFIQQLSHNADVAVQIVRFFFFFIDNK
jgi:hypothetical protein